MPRSLSRLRLSLRQLQVFCSVAATGSTAAAAQSIALSQSATSAALLELERALSLSLFERIGKGLALNESGRALLPQALALLDGAQAIEDWAQDRGQVGRLRIGASTTIGNYLLPAFVAAFRASLPESARPSLDLQVTIANTEVIARGVAAFDLDLGLIEGPCHEEDLLVRPWLEDELLIVASPADPIVPRHGRGAIGLPALQQATWLLRERGSGTREVIHQLLTPHLQRMRHGIEFGNSEAIKRATAQGIGISCLSRYVVEDFLQTGRLVAPPVRLPRLSRRFYLLLHARKQRTRGLELMLECLEGWHPAPRAGTGRTAAVHDRRRVQRKRRNRPARAAG